MQREFARATVLSARPILILYYAPLWSFTLQGIHPDERELEDLARTEGFVSLDDMCRFFMQVHGKRGRVRVDGWLHNFKLEGA
jgi:hypothetical protein